MSVRRQGPRGCNQSARLMLILRRRYSKDKEHPPTFIKVLRKRRRRKIMGLLEKWRPSQALDRYRSEFDDIVDRSGSDREWFERWSLDRPFLAARAPVPARPAVDLYVEDGKLVVRTELPGIDAKDVEIKVVGDLLTIKGSREEKRETKNAECLTREIRYRSFERSLSLPEGIKAEDLKAAYRDGVLQLSAPIPKEPTPKEVKIQLEESTQGLFDKRAQAA
jgi:HSP20 family protein